MSTLLARMEQITAVAGVDHEKLGFAPAGRPPERIFVKKVEKNSWASSFVRVGDEMLTVEGQAASSMTVKELARHMTSVRPLTIVFGLRTKAAAIRIQSLFRAHMAIKCFKQIREARGPSARAAETPARHVQSAGEAGQAGANAKVEFHLDAGTDIASVAISPKATSSPSHGNTKSRATRLSPEVEKHRKELAEAHAKQRALHDQQVARENKEYEKHIREAHGKDKKALSAETEHQRQQRAKEHALERAEHEKHLKQENKEFRKHIDEAGAHGKDEKALSADTEHLREQIAMEHAHERKEHERRLAQENKELQKQLQEAHGRDEKSLGEDVEKKRKQLAEQHAAEKALHDKELKEENKEYEKHLREAGAHGRDAKALSSEVEEQRKQIAREHATQKAQHEEELRQANREFKQHVNDASLHGRDEKSLGEDVERHRKQLAAEHAAERALHEIELKEKNKEHVGDPAQQLRLVQAKLEACEKEKRELRLELDKVKAVDGGELRYSKNSEGMLDVKAIDEAQAALDVQRAALVALREEATKLMKELQRRLQEAEEKIQQLTEENTRLRGASSADSSKFGETTGSDVALDNDVGKLAKRFATFVQDCETKLSFQSHSIQKTVSSKVEGVDLVPMWSTLYNIGCGESYTDDGKPSIEGHLFKRGPMYGYDWTKVWSVLLRDHLLCFTDSSCREKKSEVKITPCMRALSFQAADAPGDAPKHRSEKEFGFVVEERKSRRFFYFHSESHDQMEAWLKALDAATQEVTRKAAIQESILKKVEEWEGKFKIGPGASDPRHPASASFAPSKSRSSMLRVSTMMSGTPALGTGSGTS